MNTTIVKKPEMRLWTSTATHGFRSCQRLRTRGSYAEDYSTAYSPVNCFLDHFTTVTMSKTRCLTGWRGVALFSISRISKFLVIYHSSDTDELFKTFKMYHKTIKKQVNKTLISETSIWDQRKTLFLYLFIILLACFKKWTLFGTGKRWVYDFWFL